MGTITIYENLRDQSKKRAPGAGFVDKTFFQDVTKDEKKTNKQKTSITTNDNNNNKRQTNTNVLPSAPFFPDD